jgi:uncharacterized protein (DUF2132 family)
MEISLTESWNFDTLTHSLTRTACLNSWPSLFSFQNWLRHSPWWRHSLYNHPPHTHTHTTRVKSMEIGYVKSHTHTHTHTRGCIVTIETRWLNQKTLTVVGCDSLNHTEVIKESVSFLGDQSAAAVKECPLWRRDFSAIKLWCSVEPWKEHPVWSRWVTEVAKSEGQI